VQPLAPESGHAERRRGADGSEDQALRQQVRHEAGPAGAERHPHRQLLAKAGRAGEEKIRDVRARDQQDDERDRGEPLRHGRLRRGPRATTLRERTGENPRLGVVAARCDRLGPPADVKRRRLFERHDLRRARRQPDGGVDEPPVAVREGALLSFEVRPRSQRYPDVDRRQLQAGESGRRDTHDLPRL